MRAGDRASGSREVLTNSHEGCTFTTHQRAAGLNPERAWWSERRRVWCASARFVGVLLSFICSEILACLGLPDEEFWWVAPVPTGWRPPLSWCW